MNNAMRSGKSYSFIKSYTLIAQTPLIHFQHAQEGATLRATEVKPKLDRFLLKRLSETDPKWFVRNEQKALDYKLHFTAINSEGNPIAKVPTIELGRFTPYDIYYGNMGDGEIVKGVMTRVKMTVTCVHSELMKEIEDNLAAFFIVTNFGRMQDKGFGSFIIDGFDEFYDEATISNILKEEYSAVRCYLFDGGTKEQVFKRIKAVYSLMKSGIAYGNRPQPSLLFSYLQGDSYRMTDERTWLKKEVVAARQRQNRKYRYVRALLGVGDHIDLRKPVQVSVKISNDEIERLPSPILFKVFPGEGNSYIVYYVPGRINDTIYGKTFKFSSPRGNGECRVPNQNELITESGEDFIDDFLYYCYEKFRDTNILDSFRDTNNLYIYIGGDIGDGE